MNVFKSLMVAAAGMRAQNARMRVISQNIANANSAPTREGQDPYRRQIPTFLTRLHLEQRTRQGDPATSDTPTHSTADDALDDHSRHCSRR